MLLERYSMNAGDFRRMALSLEGAEEGSHMGAADFRVGGRIFATLASEKQGYGNLMLTPEQQAAFVGELPEVFLPIPGGWGRMGLTAYRLAARNQDVVEWPLRTAVRRRMVGIWGCGGEWGVNYLWGWFLRLGEGWHPAFEFFSGPASGA